MRVFIVDMKGGKWPYIGYQIRTAFEKVGHKTKAFDYRKWKLQHFSITNKILNKLIVYQVKKWQPDIVLVNKGESILPGTISNITKLGIKAVAWNLDEPFGHLDAFNKIKNITEYDAYFTYDTQYIKPLKKHNKHTYHLPAAADPFGVHKEKILFEKRTFPADLCLVGTAYENRIKLIKPFINNRLNLAGPRWNTAPKKFADQALPVVKITKMVKLFNESKIVLNPYGASKHFIVPNPRTFEIPATRSFQLTDMPREVNKYFKPKKEIVLYKDKREFKELVDYYLENDDERNKIVQAGYDRVVKEHTMVHRIKKMLSIIK